MKDCKKNKMHRRELRATMWRLHIVAIRVFNGWMLKESRKAIEEGREWIGQVLSAVERG